MRNKARKILVVLLAVAMMISVIVPGAAAYLDIQNEPLDSSVIHEVVFAASFYAAHDGFEPRGAGVTFTNENISQTPGDQSLLVSNRNSVLHGAQVNLTDIIIPNVEYEFSMWVQSVAGSQNMRLGFQIGYTSTIFAGSTQTVTDDGWVQLVGRATFPSTAHAIVLFVDSGAPTASFVIDTATLARVGPLPEIVPPVSEGQELQIFLDQTRQQIDGFVLSGAFRQIDHLLNGFADRPDLQEEILDLVFGHHTGVYPEGHSRAGEPVDPAAKGIGLSIWRNQISDKAELWNYLWRQPPNAGPGQMAGGGGGQSWGRWFDTAAFSFRPFAPDDPDHFYGLNLPRNAPLLDDVSYRWWMDARDTAAVNWHPDVHPDPWDRTHIPTINYPLGRPRLTVPGTVHRLDDFIGIIDTDVTYMDGRPFPGWMVREGGPYGNAAFDRFDWPEAPGNQDIVARNGRSPVDRGQVWASRIAMAYAEARGEEMKIMAAGWSGPAWLKSTGRVNGGHIVNAEWALRDYAHFLADYIQGWETIYGVPIWGLSLSNEPEQANHVYSKSGWVTNTVARPPGAVDFGIRYPQGTIGPAPAPLPTWQSTSPSYMPFARDVLGPVLAERGLRNVLPDGTVEGVRFQMGDSQSYGSSPPIYQRFWGNSAEQFIDDYVFHTYSWQSIGGSNADTAALREWKVRAQMNNRGMIMSEISTMSGQNATNIFDFQRNALRNQNGTASRSDMGSAIAWAQYWNRQLSIMEISGTGQWWAVGFKKPEQDWPMAIHPGDRSLENLIYITNDARGQSAGPAAPSISLGGLEGATANHRGIGARPDEILAYQHAGPEGGFYTEQTFDYRVHKVFWALGHFSKFVRPGWYRVNVNQDVVNEGAAFPNNLNLMTSAYRSPEADEDGYYDFSVIVINGTRLDQTIDINFPGYIVESMERWETIEDVLCTSVLDVPHGTLLSSAGANNTITNATGLYRESFVRGWTDGVRNRDDARGARVPTHSQDVPSHIGTPHGNNMVLHGEVEAWINGGAVVVPFASMTTFVGRARVAPDASIDATTIIPFFNYNELEGAAVNNNNVNLTDPRVETMRIPTQDFDTVLEPGMALMHGFTNNTFARFTFNRINFGSGMDTLVLNTGGAYPGLQAGDVTTGELPIRVYIDGELATAPNAVVEVSPDQGDREVPLTGSFTGVNDVVIQLGADGSSVIARLNSLTFVECDFTVVVTPPTCTDEGYTTKTCETCGDVVVVDRIPALGHDWSEFQVDPDDSEIEFKVCERCEEIYTRYRELVFTGSNPNRLRDDYLAQVRYVTLATPRNLGIFEQHSEFIVPENTTLFVATTLNIERNAELIIRGTVVILEGGRINNQGSGTGGTVTIAETGTLENNGHFENVTRSTLENNGTIVNNGRFEVRADSTFYHGVVEGDTPLNINRQANVSGVPIIPED
ncbi:MAG: carbohydrate binding domain-containing protein [Oscillospiraceae bacterium]|nr:carbohydrate binding domain-containing protein [Oscillospiraceae bacterium]